MKLSITLLLAAALFTSSAFADDTGGGSGDSASGSNIETEIREARSLIKREKYKSAIQTLNLVVQKDHRNADAWNLLGFSQRKLGNYKRAGKYYKKALKLNPDHRGALEYQGHLFLALNDVDRAKGNLHQLQQLCPVGCDQLTKLTQAVASSGS